MSGSSDAAVFALTFTHRGRRKRNEDSVRQQELPDGSRLVVVCDGMGGHAGGDFASASAADGLIDRVRDGIDPVDAITEVNGELYRIASEDPARLGMGTTLVAALIRDGQAMVYNVGDSRAYRLTSLGRTIQVTRDHSFVAESVSAGTMDAQTAAQSQYKNALTRAVATEAGIDVDAFGPIPLTDGNLLFLCSDGFYKSMEDTGLADLLSGPLRRLPSQLEQAIVAAFDAGSDDNISAVLVGVGALPSSENGRLNKRLGKVMDARVRAFERRRDNATRPTRPRGGLVQRALGLLLLVVGGGALYFLLDRSEAVATPGAVATETRDDGRDRRDSVVSTRPVPIRESQADRAPTAKRDTESENRAERTERPTAARSDASARRSAEANPVRPAPAAAAPATAAPATAAPATAAPATAAPATAAPTTAAPAPPSSTGTNRARLPVPSRPAPKQPNSPPGSGSKQP